MNTKSILLASVLALSANWAMAETAQDDTAVIEQGFAAMDGNKDGSVSKDEFTKYMTGYLAAQREEFDKGFNALDTNKDGKISKEESAGNSALEASFDQIDEDGDGFVNKDDLRAAMQAAQEAPLAE